MTLGQRIAALRKEKGLSQEQLGELVGVSRQAVSKWEADKAVPDVDNCVAMSKAFGIPLARLLELEEGEAALAAPGEDERLERLMERYVSAQRAARRRWRWPVILLACALVVGGAWLWDFLDSMDRSIDELSGELVTLRGEIVSGVGDRFEESLEARDSLLSDLTYQVVDAEPLNGTITYEITVTPKTAGEGASVRFWARSGGKEAAVEAQPGAGQTWSGRLTCPLTDEIRLYMALTEDGQTRSELLATEYGMDQEFSLRLEVYCPQSLEGTELFYGGVPGKKMGAVGVMGFLRLVPEMDPVPAFGEVWIGVFVNDELVQRVEKEPFVNRGEDEESINLLTYFKLENLDMKYEDTLTIAVFAEDNYGRRVSRITQRYWVDAGETLHETPWYDLDDGTYGLEAW